MAGSGTARGLSRLLRPRSIAVLGGKQAAEVIRQLRLVGYGGAVWPVHPTRDEIAGERAYRSVDALPAAPDAVFIGVNRHATIEVIGALARRGAGGAVVHAAGFAEAGDEGKALQAALTAAAGAMPFFGPNCYGFINYLDAVLLWPDQHGGKRVERGVGIVTQSGNIGLNLTMQRRALPIAYLVTLGNQAQIDPAATIEALLADERVTAIGLHLEGIADAAAFTRAALRARQRGIPIVALKTGTSAAGAELTVSHTASLAGSGAAVAAFLRKCGVVSVRSIPVLLETLKLLHMGGPLAGGDIASMSCSGGEAALIADAAEGRRLRFRAFSPEQKAAVAATLPDLVTVSNPLDYHTFTWANGPALTQTFAAVMDAGFAMTMLVLDFPRLDRCNDRDWLISADAMIAAAQRTGARATIVATLPEAMPEERAEALAAAGIVPLLGLDEALTALEAAAEAGALARSSDLPPLSFEPLRIGAARTLGEWEGKRLLAKHGVTVPDGRLVHTPEEAVSAAVALGFPLALKAVGERIAHKTEIGAVRLGLADTAAVLAAARDLQGLGEAMLVERMVTEAAAELIVGVNRDPVVGLCLLIGSGGILAELVGDRAVIAMPATRQEIIDAIRPLKATALLEGYRSGPRGDFDAAVDAVLAVQRFAIDHAARLLELDVNPLMVRAKEGGAVAADVLIRLIEEDRGD